MLSLNKKVASHLQTSTILTGVMALMASAQSAHADAAIPALPVLDKIAAGTATTSTTAHTFKVDQSSDRLIADFRSFDIANGNEVNVLQPSGGAALFRVGGNRASQIDGKLNATGMLVIVNPRGQIYSGTAEVNVGGLVASTADIDNNKFMQGGALAFNKAGDADAKIVNEGKIKIADGGLALLVGPNVTNDGLIEAKLGKVQLASGDTFAVDLYGDGLLNLQASPQLNKQLVKNSGKINADGGAVLLTAAAAQNTVDSLINMDGLIQANNVGTKNGKIVLLAEGTSSKKSTTTVSGKIEAKGGSVSVLGDRVALLAGTDIDVSGTNGGGTVLVGGDYQGKGATPTATNTYVAEGAKIKANAIDNGNGGKVIIWANDTTGFFGSIEAKGGAASGNGGFIETSGKKYLDALGTVTANAAHGKAGTWLLDPADITISNAANTAGTYTGGVYASSADTGNLNVAQLEGSLNSGTNVTLTTTVNPGSTDANAGDVSFLDSVTKTGGVDSSFTIDAAHNITFANGVSLSSTNSKLDVNLNAGNKLAFNAGSSINTNGGNLTAHIFRMVNLAGANVFNTGAGRWVIYANDIAPGSTTVDTQLGGLVSNFHRFGGAAAAATGNGVVYAQDHYISIAPNAATATYGDAASYTSNLSGFLLGDSAATATTGAAGYTSPYAQGSNIGTYDITANQGTLLSDVGYKFTGSTLTNGLTVDKRVVNFTIAGATSKTYDGTLTANLNASNVAFDNLYLPDTTNGGFNVTSVSGAFYDKNAGTGKSVHLTNVSADGTKLGNYTFNWTNAGITGDIGTIDQAQLTVKAHNQTLTYGVNDVLAPNATVTGLVNGETVDTLIFNTNAANAGNQSSSGHWKATNGTPWIITASGASATTGEFLASNYNIDYQTGALTIDRAALAITSATVNNKTYDGNDTATGISLWTDNRVAGDNLGYGVGGATFNNANAGIGKTVTINGLYVYGTDVNNYTLNTNLTTTANIDQAALNIKANNQTLTYGDSVLAQSFTPTGLVNGETVGAVTLNTNATTSGAGKWKATNGTLWNITASAPTGGTFNPLNYAITYTGGKLTINRAIATVTAVAADKVYDGLRNASVVLSDNGLVGDTVNQTFTTARFADKNAAVGKLVTVSGIALTGADASNYTLGNTTATDLADISKRGLTVSALSTGKVYDGTTDATVLLLDNRVLGDSLTRSYTASYADKNAGAGKTITVSGITLSGTDANNYTLLNPGQMTTTTAEIFKRGLLITAHGVDKIYDGNTSDAATYTDNRLAIDAGAGKINTTGTANFLNKDVGTNKAIAVTNLAISGSEAGNYFVLSPLAFTTANIDARALTIKANDKTTMVYGDAMTYNGATALAGATPNSGLVAGESIGGVTLTSAAETNLSTSNNWRAGDYTIEASNAANNGAFKASNYAISYQDGVLSIAQKDANVSATATSRTYDGTDVADVQLIFNGVITNDIVNGQPNSGTFSDKNAELGKTVSVSGITISGADADNYTTATSTTATADITPYTLQVNADFQTKLYGRTDPALTYTHAALLGTDTEANTFTGGLTRAAGEHVADGPRAITIGSLSAGGNYTVDYIGNVLVITPAPLGVVANNQFMPFGSTLPNLTYTVSGLQFSDTIGSVLTGDLSTSALNTSPAGDYDINQGSLASNSDYDIFYTPGNLRIGSLQDLINAALNGSDGPSTAARAGKNGTLLSISNNSGGNAPTGGFGNLSPAAGGENPQGNPGSLEPAAGGATALLECNEENPCQATQ